MPYAGINKGGEFGGGFFGILCARIAAGKEFPRNDPIGTRKGDW